MKHIKLISLFILANLIELLSLFRGLDSKLIVFNSTRNNFFNFNSQYLFLSYLKYSKEYKVYFVINNKKKRDELTEKYGKHFICSNSLKGMLKVSRAKTWVTSVLETPYLPLYILQNKRRIIYHIGHGIPLKKIGLAEQNINFFQYINRYLRTRLFTHVLAYSNDFKPYMEQVFQNKKTKYVLLGQPRNDAIEHDKYNAINTIKSIIPTLDQGAKLILYAPTWRDYAKTVFFPFSNLSASELNKHLVDNNSFLFLRYHPFFPAFLEEEYLLCSNIKLINSDVIVDITGILSAFDKLITDYSSIYLDFLCLDRPIAFIPYDLAKYESRIGFFMDYEDMTPGVKLSSKQDLIRFIASEEDLYSQERRKLVKVFNIKSKNNNEENRRLISSLIDQS